MEYRNPEIPENLQENLEREKEQAFTLYLDFVIDGTASMYSVFPAVYYAVIHFLDTLTRYEAFPKIGMTVLQSGSAGEEPARIMFDDGEMFTPEISGFLKKLRGLPLYGGGNDGKESVHTAIASSLAKFPVHGRNTAVMVFTDAYASDDRADYSKEPVGQVLIFSTEELSEEDFMFCFVREDGSYDEEGSPMFLSIESLLKPLSTEFIDDVVKPLKDLVKGVSVGA